MKYYIKDWGQEAEDAYFFDTVNEITEKHDVEWKLSDIGNEIWNEHDGWEANWPLTVTVIDDVGKEYECLIEMEAEPVFHGHCA